MLAHIFKNRRINYEIKDKKDGQWHQLHRIVDVLNATAHLKMGEEGIAWRQWVQTLDLTKYIFVDFILESLDIV